MTRRSPPQDDARALLADILQDTQAQALEEDRRLQQTQAQRLAAQAQQAALQDQQRQQRADALLREEADRQRLAAQRRTDRLKALDGPSTQEQEALQRAHDEAQRRVALEQQLAQAEAARRDAERRAQAAAAPTPAPAAPQPAPAPARRAPWGAAIAAAALSIAAALTLVAGVAAWSARPEPPQTFSKLTWQPEHLRAHTAERGFSPLPSPAEATQPALARPDRRKRANDATIIKKKFQFDGGEDVFDPRRP